MNILTLHTTTKIIGWLIGEPIESADAHLPHYLDYIDADGNPARYDPADVSATVIDVPDEDQFRPDLYEVVNGVVQRKQP
jgi:hypothetical protein